MMDTHEQQVRTWSMLCHFAALASLFFPLGNIIGPFVVWQIKKNELPEIDEHAKESLNFQLTILLITVVFFIALFGTLGFGVLVGNPFSMIAGGLGFGLLLFFIRLISWVLVIVAGVKANNGEMYRYPSIRFIR